jgi:hypothetical protein
VAQAILQVLEAQLAVPCVELQMLPQVPQLLTSATVLISQPFATLLSQLP